ncbi:hypothetical protein [Clostridium fallax]|uniref:Uncharacterized protein n=1 Tax=Clostridium fallax TaxID=1533 RepID=A0A1M4XYN6_9CLOT|nr:hypothetical protein [Clostridium fallax]SHE98677.1 hypothetical protein SAMN05443638_12222 [Clostridium fallax]SQB06489.1 Uncharacterised protein [Clostridium fallax]
MNKIYEAQLREFLMDIKEKKEFSNFKVYRAGAYIFKDQIYLFVDYEGQNLSEIVYTEKYDKLYDFTEEVKDYLLGEYSTDDLIHMLYRNINKMI